MVVWVVPRGWRRKLLFSHISKWFLLKVQVKKLVLHWIFAIIWNSLSGPISKPSEWIKKSRRLTWQTDTSYQFLINIHGSAHFFRPTLRFPKRVWYWKLVKNCVFGVTFYWSNAKKNTLYTTNKRIIERNDIFVGPNHILPRAFPINLIYMSLASDNFGRVA